MMDRQSVSEFPITNTGLWIGMSQAHHLKSTFATRKVKHDQKEHFLHSFKFPWASKRFQCIKLSWQIFRTPTPSKKSKAGDRGSIVEENTNKKKENNKKSHNSNPCRQLHPSPQGTNYQTKCRESTENSMNEVPYLSVSFQKGKGEGKERKEKKINNTGRDEQKNSKKYSALQPIPTKEITPTKKKGR